MSAHQEEGITPELTPQPQIYTDKNDHGLFRGMIVRQERTKGMTKAERHAYLKDKNINLAVDAQRATEAKYAAAGQTFDPEDDIRPDGGVRKFSMYKTVFGICWTTLRSVSIFPLAIKIASRKNSDSSYPGPLSVMILFASAQTYLAGRGMPRIFNTILAYDLMLIWVAFVLSSFRPGGTIKYYGKIGVQGGNCPFFDRAKYNTGHE